MTGAPVPEGSAEITPTEPTKLPALIDAATRRLDEAKSSGELLEAMHVAEAAMHYAKVSGAANEVKADCLRIITRAEMRLAAAVDDGQAAGVIAKADGTVHPGNKGVRSSDTIAPATLEEIRVDRKRLSEWRNLRAAGEPAVMAAIDQQMAEGKAPTKRGIHSRVAPRRSRDAKRAAAKRKAAEAQRTSLLESLVRRPAIPLLDQETRISGVIHRLKFLAKGIDEALPPEELIKALELIPGSMATPLRGELRAIFERVHEKIGGLQQALTPELVEQYGSSAREANRPDAEEGPFIDPDGKAAGEALAELRRAFSDEQLTIVARCERIYREAFPYGHFANAIEDLIAPSAALSDEEQAIADGLIERNADGRLVITDKGRRVKMRPARSAALPCANSRPQPT